MLYTYAVISEQTELILYLYSLLETVGKIVTNSEAVILILSFSENKLNFMDLNSNGCDCAVQK